MSLRERRFLSPSVRREAEETTDLLSSGLLRRWRRRRDEVEAASSMVLPPRSLRPPKAAFHIFYVFSLFVMGIKVCA